MAHIVLMTCSSVQSKIEELDNLAESCGEVLKEMEAKHH